MWPVCIAFGLLLLASASSLGATSLVLHRAARRQGACDPRAR